MSDLVDDELLGLIKAHATLTVNEMLPGAEALEGRLKKQES